MSCHFHRSKSKSPKGQCARQNQVAYHPICQLIPLNPQLPLKRALGCPLVAWRSQKTHFDAYPSFSRAPHTHQRAPCPDLCPCATWRTARCADRTVIFDHRMIIGVSRAAAASGVFKYRKYLCLENWKARGGGAQTCGRGLFMNLFCLVFSQHLQSCDRSERKAFFRSIARCPTFKLRR